MDFWKLFLAALMPVLKVLLITGVGALLALDRFQILNQSSKKSLNTAVFFVFGPALLCSSLAKTLTPESMAILWFMPINVLLTFIIGTALGWLLVKTTKTPHHLHGLVLGSCAAGNLGALPLIIVPAVCRESSGAFGAIDVCYTNGLAYASLSLALGSIYTWSFVYNLIRVWTCKSTSVDKVDDSTVNSVPATDQSDAEKLSKCRSGQLVAVEESSQENDHMDQLEIECKMTHEEAKVPKKEKIVKQLKMLAEKINLKAIFAPTTTGAIVGLVIGLVPPFRKLLIGSTAPLHVVQDSASMIGDAAVPTVTLLVGANLLKGLKGPGMQISLIVGINIVKYIALPAAGVGIVKGVVHFRLIHPNPLYQFVLLLQFALPPAMDISTMTQLVGVGEGEYSVIMLVTYCCAAISLTLWCTFFMWLVL